MLPLTKCEEWYTIEAARKVQLFNSHLCAGYEAGGKDACQVSNNDDDDDDDNDDNNNNDNKSSNDNNDNDDN